MTYYTSVNSDGEDIHTLKYFKEVLKHDKLDKLILEEMQQDIGGPMWCSVLQNFVIYNDTCGCNCEQYYPCNNRSGRCRHLKNGYIGTGKIYILVHNKLIKFK